MARVLSRRTPIELDDAVFGHFLKQLSSDEVFIVLLYSRNHAPSATLLDVLLNFSDSKTSIHTIAIADTLQRSQPNPKCFREIRRKEKFPELPAICILQAKRDEPSGFRVESCVSAGSTAEQQHQRIADCLKMISLWCE